MAERHVKVARQWIGTPYRHQASVRGVGCDCLGLIRGIWREDFGTEPEIPGPYTPDWSEISGEERLEAAAMRHLMRRPVDLSRLGDVLLFRMKRGHVAKHLGITSGTAGAPKMIHALSGRSVCEVTLTPDWQARIVAQFSFPERRT